MLPAAWLIRHGESTANAGAPTKDPASTPLTELGHEQAAAIELPAPPSRIIVSKYIRTRLTAEPTIDRFPEVPVETWPIEEFTFLDPSKYHDTTQAERAVHARAYIDRNDPYYRDGGEAESFYDLLSRAAETLDHLKGLRNAAVFSHARFIQAMRWVYLGRAGKPADFFAWVEDHPVANTSVTTLYFRLVPRGWVLQ